MFQISRYVPLTHVVPLRGTWMGTGWGELTTRVGVLVGVLVVGAAVSPKSFRWE